MTACGPLRAARVTVPVLLSAARWRAAAAVCCAAGRLLQPLRFFYSRHPLTARTPFRFSPRVAVSPRAA